MTTILIMFFKRLSEVSPVTPIPESGWTANKLGTRWTAPALGVTWSANDLGNRWTAP